MELDKQKRDKISTSLGEIMNIARAEHVTPEDSLARINGSMFSENSK